MMRHRRASSISRQHRGSSLPGAAASVPLVQGMYRLLFGQLRAPRQYRAPKRLVCGGHQPPRPRMRPAGV
jgi:hypothetical protein